MLADLSPKTDSLVEQMVPSSGKIPSRKYALIAFWEQTEVAASEQCWKKGVFS